MKTHLLEKFLRYVRVYTESEPFVDNIPSTNRQFDLANILVAELKAIGMHDVALDAHCYVTATLPSNIDKIVPTIGFIAHLDTSPDMTGENVNPQIWENYDGTDIQLNETYTLKPSDFPSLKDYIGQTLITTDGTTLLGADDKAGVTEIMMAMEYLIQSPDIQHGTIKICFTPDEEVGKGADLFDIAKFDADWAYTMDGGEIGELEYENFNAAYAKITAKGRSVHPGYAKDKMINAITIIRQFADQLPFDEVPEMTEGYEGFFHLTQLQGTIEEASAEYIIRDHNQAQFEARKQLIIDIVAEMNQQFEKPLLEVFIKDQYKNMRAQIEPVMHIIDIAQQAMIQANITPKIKAIRGGTDGAQLSYKGLPCPNIFAGGLNFHGRFEYIPLESMVKATEVIITIAQLVAKKD